MSLRADVVEGQPLSAAELEILDAVSRGLIDVKIARGRGVSLHTIRHQILSIKVKLGAVDRTHMVTRGFEAGYLLVANGGRAVLDPGRLQEVRSCP